MAVPTHDLAPASVRKVHRVLSMGARVRQWQGRTGWPVNAAARGEPGCRACTTAEEETLPHSRRRLPELADACRGASTGSSSCSSPIPASGSARWPRCACAGSTSFAAAR